MRDFRELTKQAFEAKKFLCVGLDPVWDKLPSKYYPKRSRTNRVEVIYQFGIDVIDAVGGICGFLKPNYAFFLQCGPAGLEVLEKLIQYAQSRYPNMVIIVDCKIGDIGNTNVAYAEYFFNTLKADAITVNPYLGGQALEPLLQYENKGLFVLCHTSNDGAAEFQSLSSSGKSLFSHVATNVNQYWNSAGNCGLVAGATYPEQIVHIRSEFTRGPILIPGIGTQGGDLQSSIKAAMTSRGDGFIINSSSSIIFRSKPEEAAKKLDRQILACLS